MSNTSNEPTLTVQGFTPYAQIPQWVIRSGDDLSHGAVRLYGVIMSYADNKTRAAFPSREKLAEDMGSSVATVKRCIKELEDYGALTVTRRRNKRTGNFYANHYVLVFASPWVTHDPPPEDTDDPITKPTEELDPLLYTSDQRSDDHVARSPEASARPKPTLVGDGRQYASTNPGNFTGDQRWTLIKKLQIVGRRLTDGHNFYDEPTQEAWDDFTYKLEEYANGAPWLDELIDEIENGKWTVSAQVVDAYQAATKLNKMVHSAS